MPASYEAPLPEPELLAEPWDRRIIDDMSADPRYANSPTVKAGMRSVLGLPVRVEGRLYEVRVARAEAQGEYRLLIVRGTVVVNPDPKREAESLWNVVQPFMQRTCNGPFVVLDNHLASDINLYIRFRCGTA